MRPPGSPVFGNVDGLKSNLPASLSIDSMLEKLTQARNMAAEAKQKAFQQRKQAEGDKGAAGKAGGSAADGSRLPFAAQWSPAAAAAAAAAGGDGGIYDNLFGNGRPMEPPKKVNQMWGQGRGTPSVGNTMFQALVSALDPEIVKKRREERQLMLQLEEDRLRSGQRILHEAKMNEEREKMMAKKRVPVAAVQSVLQFAARANLPKKKVLETLKLVDGVRGSHHYRIMLLLLLILDCVVAVVCSILIVLLIY